MNLGELLGELREHRLDDNVPPYLWTDADLVGYLNDAVRQVCFRQRCLIEAVNVSVCQYPLAIGQRLVKLHPSIIAVRTARIVNPADTNYRCQLQGISMKRLFRDGWCEHWETAANGRSDYWVPDYQEGYLAIDRPSDIAATLVLTCWRTPTDDELLEEGDTEGEPVISQNWHKDLLDWATYVAFLRKDAETIDRNSGSDAEAAFTAKIGRLPSAVEMRLWGIAPTRRTRAEFV